MDFAQDYSRVFKLQGRHHLYWHLGYPWKSDRAGVEQERERLVFTVCQVFSR